MAAIKIPGSAAGECVVPEVQIWPLDRLVPYDRNSRTHSEDQIAQLMASIREFGFTNPILAAPDGEIIAGHARQEAARRLGMTAVPVMVFAHLTPAQRRALVIADNRIPQNAGWDEEVLRTELAALQAEAFDLDVLGFTDAELDDLLRAAEGEGGAEDDDEAPEAGGGGPVVTKQGDLWICGDHRVLCGDSTIHSVVCTVLNNGAADMAFTDPPWNVDYCGGSKVKHRGKNVRRIANDDQKDGFLEFLRAAFDNIVLATNGGIYICVGFAEVANTIEAFRAAGGHWSTFVIWAKDRFTIGTADYQRQYEPILYGWREGAKHYWCGARDQGDVWHLKRPHKNDLHPTMKPVELAERAITNSSRRGDVVLDPFGGSGSTMIACEKTGRRGASIDTEPKYCDVMVRRWQEFAAGQAVLHGDGRSFEEVAREGRK